MAHIDAIDVSSYQGVINWGAVPQPIAILKASEGTSFLDPYLFRNYDEAKHKHGKAVGMYHFARGTDAVAEANWFIQCCQPLEQDDVFVLDWEISHPDPVGWCLAFVNRVHQLTGVWPLIYMNGSTLNAYRWDAIRANCGTWVAWYGRDPDVDLPVSGTYVMHQYTSSGAVPGIAGNVDLDAWFGTLAQFKKYGWQTAAPPTTTTTTLPPAPEPTTTTTTTLPPTTTTTTTLPITTTTTLPPVPTPQPPIKGAILALLAAIGVAIAAFLAWLNS